MYPEEFDLAQDPALTPSKLGVVLGLPMYQGQPSGSSTGLAKTQGQQKPPSGVIYANPHQTVSGLNLPPGWEARVEGNGRVLYIDHNNKVRACPLIGFGFGFRLLQVSSPILCSTDKWDN